MRVRDTVTTPGGARANEDRVGHSGTLAWVIDGCTDLHDDAFLPADNDVQWLVDLVGEQLTRAGAANYQGAGADLLAAIADEVARQQTALDFPGCRTPPACSVAVYVDQGDTYEITRVGDATAVVAGRSLTLLATDYFDHREAAAVAVRADSSPDQVVEAMRQRRLFTMTSGDTESVFSGHPRRRLRPHRIAGPQHPTDRVLLCTDGFARLVNDYQLYRDWADVVADAYDRGLAYLEKLIRDAESGPAARQGRFKRADDVAALLIAED